MGDSGASREEAAAANDDEGWEEEEEGEDSRMWLREVPTSDAVLPTCVLWFHACVFKCVYVCVCVCARARVCVYACVRVHTPCPSSRSAAHARAHARTHRVDVARDVEAQLIPQRAGEDVGELPVPHAEVPERKSKRVCVCETCKRTSLCAYPITPSLPPSFTHSHGQVFGHGVVHVVGRGPAVRPVTQR